MKIRTTEPVTDTDGVIHSTGTEAEFLGDGETWVGGKDFETDEGAVLWGLVPVQYEIIEEEK